MPGKKTEFSGKKEAKRAIQNFAVPQPAESVPGPDPKAAIAALRKAQNPIVGETILFGKQALVPVLELYQPDRGADPNPVRGAAHAADRGILRDRGELNRLKF